MHTLAKLGISLVVTERKKLPVPALFARVGIVRKVACNRDTTYTTEGIPGYFMYSNQKYYRLYCRNSADIQVQGS